MSYESAHRTFYQGVKPAKIDMIHAEMRTLSNGVAAVLRPFIEQLTPEQLIGNGRERIVYAYPPNKVMAFMRGGVSAEELKIKYYERKIAKALLPSLVSDAHLATPPLMVMEAVIGTPIISVDDKARTELAREITESRFSEVGITIDTFADNFVLAEDGAAVYVDSLHNADWELKWST